MKYTNFFVFSLLFYISYFKIQVLGVYIVMDTLCNHYVFKPQLQNIRALLILWIKHDRVTSFFTSQAFSKLCTYEWSALRIMEKNCIWLKLEIFSSLQYRNMYVEIYYELTSSFVVWLELIKYVWKPERPTMDHTEKKHTTASNTVIESQGKICKWKKKKDIISNNKQLQSRSSG